MVSSDGEQTVDALVDGKFAARADRPDEYRPWAYLELGAVEGREVGVYLESRNDGATFVTDLFVDGFSQLTADPISTLDLRIVDAEAYPTRVPADYSRLVERVVLVILLVAAIAAVAGIALLWYMLANLTMGY